MKLSPYIVFVPIEDGYLAYNTLTQSLLLLNQQTKDTLTKSPDAIQLDESLIPLIEEKFLIPETIDGNDVIHSWFNDIRNNNQTLNLTILTTYACNLACVYCVEEGVIKPINMDAETQNRSIQWIKKQIEEKQILHVRLCFYGGEPLLNLDAITQISSAIREYCEAANLEYNAEIISNGVLLDKPTANKLVECGISQVKVTIDGNRKHHNRKRPSKTRIDSYQTILVNLLDLPESLDLIISGNYDAENIASFPEMLDDLKELGLVARIKYISFKPILNTRGNASAIAAHCASISFAESDLAAIVNLRNESKSRGFAVPDYLVLGPCEFNFENSLVIDPVGNFYKCAGFVGRPEFIIGNINSGYNQKYNQFLNADIPQICFDCIYMPICGAGCRYCAQVKFGDYNRVVCEKPYFELVGQAVVKSDYSMVTINEGK